MANRGHGSQRAIVIEVRKKQVKNLSSCTSHVYSVANSHITGTLRNIGGIDLIGVMLPALLYPLSTRTCGGIGGYAPSHSAAGSEKYVYGTRLTISAMATLATSPSWPGTCSNSVATGPCY